MTIITTAGGFAVDQVPIEEIEPGETVLTHLPDGSPSTFVVEIKRIDIDKAAGTATVRWQAGAKPTPTALAWSRPSKRRLAPRPLRHRGTEPEA